MVIGLTGRLPWIPLTFLTCDRVTGAHLAEQRIMGRIRDGKMEKKRQEAASQSELY